MSEHAKKPHRRSAADVEASKPWWQSVTVLGGLLSIIAPLLGAISHYEFSVEETNQIAVYLVGIFGGVGGLLAIWGRVRAGHIPTSISLGRK